MTAPSTILAAGKLPAETLAALLERHIRHDDPAVIVAPAPGFDAAVIRPGADIIVKSDPITFSTASPADYLVAVNANDIACLGGIPKWMTVTALFPHGTTTEADVASAFETLARSCERIGVSLVGGHTEITPAVDRLILSGTMIGIPGERGTLIPGGAKPGDEIFMTQAAGIEGSSIIATEIPATHLQGIPADVIATAAGYLRNPGISIVSAAKMARGLDAVTAMHDPTEGGVATAIHELADASDLGFEIELDRIPIWPATRALSDHFNISPLGLISSGVLLFAASPGAEHEIQEAFDTSGIPVARIGAFLADPGRRIARTGSGQQPMPRYDADEITRVFAQLTVDSS